MTNPEDSEAQGRDEASTPPQEVADAGLSRHLRRLLQVTALVILAALSIEQFDFTGQQPMTRLLMQTQDAPVLLLVCALLFALTRWSLPPVWGHRAKAIERAVPANLLRATIVVAVTVVLGTKLAAVDFAFSRDEAMAEFDAAIIASGQLIAEVPLEWRPFVPALQPEFRLAVPGNVAWVSSYLPGNAAIRAGLGLLFSSAATNAVLAVIALLALFGIARRLWPRRPDAWVISVLLLATSSQVLFMAMTPYAMSAHLALNLVWLWLFLRNDKVGHAAALITGFVAVGLHQLIFHPLFVAPFLLQVLIERRWKLGAFYAAGYAAISLFWVLYWHWLLARNGIAAEAASSAGLPFLISRVASMLTYFSWGGLETMVQNLIRFAAWQNPLMLVLGVAGMAAAWREGGLIRPLAAGILLTLVAMFILLPYQATGWGYRYLHGLLGNAALLGAVGWMRVTSCASRQERCAAWGLVGATAAFSMLALVPIHAYQMRSMHGPYAAAMSAIKRAKSDAVIVDSSTVFYGNDLVRNDPFLHNRPMVFDLAELDETLIRHLCGRFKIAIFEGKDALRFGVVATIASDRSDYARLKGQRDLMERLSCGGEPLGG